MTKVYMFSYQSMVEDLYYNGIGELEINNIAVNIISKLQLSKAISINDNYIVGYMTAYMLKEKFNINCVEIELL